ncbi:MAG: BCD family MFS transporter [Burkholderiaceae bacterium]
MSRIRSLGWLGIIRLGLVQTALGSIVVLTTSTMNRIMVIELALPAALPGALVALHYAIQVMRPRMGHGSDQQGRRTPWIIGGMIVLALGALGASGAIALAPWSMTAALIVSIIAFVLIGLGVGASGTALLVLLAKLVDDKRRAAAATTVWLMMIAGFVITTAIVGQLLDPYTAGRLLEITAWVGLIAVCVTVLATFRLEPSAAGMRQIADTVASKDTPQKTDFRLALKQVWAESLSRRFALFVFISMLAYSAQDLILEPFAGAVFDMTPGESTSLSSMQHGGVFCGMILVAVLAGWQRRAGGRDALWGWALLGCIASAFCLFGLAIAGLGFTAWPIELNVFLLGAANGAYAVAAIGSMMGLVSAGNKNREGLRMGLWGAAQALAFGLGGFLGAAASDLARSVFGSPALGYGLVFAVEGALFLLSGVLAWRLAKHLSSTDSFGTSVETEKLSPQQKNGPVLEARSA